MQLTVDPKALDEILALQFLVGWAGEGRCEPKRLGWWDTDMVDEAGGGDLFRRLMPVTHQWASLEAAREAGRRTDSKSRLLTAKPDNLRTLFFLGFEQDEKLIDRLRTLKRTDGATPKDLLSPMALGGEFAKDQLSSALSKNGKIAFETTPTGRHIKGKAPAKAEEMVRQLAGALVPVGAQYAMAYYVLAG